MYFSIAKRDAANTWEVDTPVKPPDVLSSIFLGSITHDQILKVQELGCSLNALYILVFLWLYKTLNECPFEGLVPSH
nr:hypothetical protein CFP56_48210 [Quercus suber]